MVVVVVVEIANWQNLGIMGWLFFCFFVFCLGAVKFHTNFLCRI